MPQHLVLSFKEAEGATPNVCMRCGRRATCRVKRSIRLYNSMDVGRADIIGAILTVIDFANILSTPTLTLRAPMCASHRSHWTVRALAMWALMAFIPIGILAIIGIGILAGWSGRGIGGVGILALTGLIVATIIPYATSIIKVSSNNEDELISFANVHPKFIEAVEQQRAGAKSARRRLTDKSPPSDPTPTAVQVGPHVTPGSEPFGDFGQGDDDDPPSRRRRAPPSRPGRLVMLLIAIPVIILMLVLIAYTVSRMGDWMAHRQQDRGGIVADRPREDEDRDVEPGKAVPNTPANVPLPAVLKDRASVDLVPLYNPRKDTVNGRWLVVNKGLHCNDGGGVPRVQFPYLPPAEYDFVVTFLQPRLRNGISLVMPNPRGGSFFWFLGNHDGAGYGFFKNPEKVNEIKGLIKKNTVYTTTVEVRKNGVRAFLDGKELLHVDTDFRDLTCDGWREIPDTRFPAIACDDPTVFYYVRIVEFNGVGKKAR